MRRQAASNSSTVIGPAVEYRWCTVSVDRGWTAATADDVELGRLHRPGRLTKLLGQRAAGAKSWAGGPSWKARQIWMGPSAS